MFSTPTVTDGGLETDLIFNHGVELAEFAAFPLVESDSGRQLLAEYYAGYADIARRADAALVLETPTWRANPGWGRRLGYDATALDRVNQASVRLLADLGARSGIEDVTICGTVGPRGDGYDARDAVDADAAQSYHRTQLESFVTAGADLATAYTLTHTGEAIGIVRAARAVGIAIGISFTVETDGRLPDGTALADAIREVDDAAAPDHFGINCAHPTHIAPALAEPGDWVERVRVLRPNASRRSHAELDSADELDAGDPAELARTRQELRLPGVTVIGGCCGTDARHVAALWGLA